MTETLNPVLDWHPPSPERKEANQPYRLFAQAGVEDPKNLRAELPPKNRSLTRRLWLDQGTEGACTGFGLGHCLGIGSKYAEVSNEQARKLYRWAQQHDQWAGENYEGSSVQGAMEGAKTHGIIAGYWWIETPEELRAALGRFGAVEVGSRWKSGMWRPDEKGYVHNTGTVEGGHAYCLGAVDLRNNRYRIDNSWGRSRWGFQGSAWIDADELHSLVFSENGEMALPRKKKLIAPSAWEGN